MQDNINEISAMVEKIDINRLVNKPKTFDGKVPHPRIFLESYVKAAEDNNWNEATKVRYFKTFLSDDAEDWYDWKIRPLMPIQNFNVLANHFTANYLGQADEDRTRAKLEETKQKPDDSACNFIPRVIRMLMMLDPLMSEREIISRIKVKMLPHYQPWIAERQPETVDQFRDVCMKVEAGMNAMKTFEAFRNVTTSTFHKQPNLNTVSTGKSGKKEYGANKKPPFKKSYKKDGDNKKNCYRCGRNNHLIKDCRAKTKLDGSNIEDKTVNAVTDKKRQDNQDENKVKVIKHCCNIICNLAGTRELLHHEFKCNSKNVTAVIDTGSTISVVDYDFAMKNGWKMFESKHRLAGAGGNILDIAGSIQLDIGLKVGKLEKSKRYDLPVVRNFIAPVLIGLDILKDFKVVVNPVSDKLEFIQEKTSKGVTLINDLLVPPRSICIVESFVPTEGTILTSTNAQNIGILVANCITNVKDNKIFCVIMNMGCKPIEMVKNSVIAQYEKVDAESLPEEKINLVLPISNERKGTVQIGANLEKEKVNELKELLITYQKAFLLEGDKLGETNILKHNIELLPGAKPFAEPLRRRPLAHIQETQKQVQKMLNEGIIENCDSPWASAYVLVRKKNGSMRLCIDYRKLNEITKKSVYPLPNIEHCLEMLSGKKFFSQIDFASGFWQIKIDEGSRDMTAFRTEDGLFRFTRMPFGLTNAPASFQKMMNILISGLKGFALQAFIDDVCIATSTWKEHLELLRKFFILVIKANLKIQPAKCVFGTDKVVFLGHEISREGIRQDPEKLKAIAKLPRPTTVNEVRRVIGMMSYYRKFVPNFSMIAEPIIRLTRKNELFVWEDEQENAFKELISSLLRDASLSHFNHTDPICVKTDASKKGVAALLLQKQNNDWKLVHCVSRRLSSSEENYGITDLEGLAIVYGLEKFRPYLLGKKFEILVDHCALCVLNKKVPTSPRLKRWAIILSEFDFEIIYTKGTLHRDIDCLSRAPVDNEEDHYLEGKVYAIPTPLNPEEYVNSYNDDESKEILEKARSNFEDYYMISEIIYYKNKLYVPLMKRNELIKLHHSSSMMGHGGTEVTMDKMFNFYWPTMKEDIKKFIDKCRNCQINKYDRSLPAGEMNRFDDCEPFHRIALDTFGPVSATIRNNKYILVAIDMFSRFIETRAIENVRAQSSFEILNEWFSRYGPPKIILTDQGPQFKNDTIKELLGNFGVEHQFSTPGHGRGNAIVERAIQTIQEKLSVALTDEKAVDNWDIILPNITFAINTSLNSSTGFTPFELVFGRRAKMNVEVEEKNMTVHDLHNQLIRKQLEENIVSALDNQLNSQSISRIQFDKRHRKQEFSVGDKVLVKPNNRRRSKLDPKYLIDPYEIVKKDKDIYHVKDLKSGKIYERHTSALKKFLVNIISMMLIVLTYISNTNGTIFEPTMPILWRPVDKIVLDSVIKIKIHFTFVNPCKKIKPSGWQPIEPVKECNYYYEEEFFSKVKSLNSIQKLYGNDETQQAISSYMAPNIQKVPDQYIQPELTANNASIPDRYTQSPFGIIVPEAPDQQMQQYIAPNVQEVPDQYQQPVNNESLPARYQQPELESWRFRNLTADKDRYVQSGGEVIKGRSLTVFAAGATTGVAVYYFMSNLVSTVRNWFSNNDEEENMKKQNEMIQKNFDVIEVSNKQIMDRLGIHDERITKLEKKWDEFTWSLPNYVWGVTKITNSINRSTDRLERIIFTIQTKNQIDLKSLTSLLNITQLCNCNQEDTKFESVRVRENTITLEFEAIQKSRDTFVFEVDYLPYWTNLTLEPTRMVYDGAQYLIYNKSNNCMKSILDVKGRVVPVTCKITDFQDKRLNKWKEDIKVSSIEEIKTDPVVKISPRYYHINCFMWNITIDGIVHPCPKSSFRIPNWRSIQVGDFDLRMEFKEYNITEGNIIVDNIYYGQFTQDNQTTDELRTLKGAETMRMELTDIKTNYIRVGRTQSISLGTMFSIILIIYLIRRYHNEILICFKAIIGKFKQDKKEDIEMASGINQESPPNYKEKETVSSIYPFKKL